MKRHEIHIGDVVWITAIDHTKPSPDDRYSTARGRVVALRESRYASGVEADIVSTTNRIWKAVDIAILGLT